MNVKKNIFKLFRKCILYVMVFSFSQHILLSQNNQNQKVVENVYDLIESNKSTQEIFERTSEVKWDTSKIGDRYTITLFAIINNDWRGVEFQNLIYREIEENKVMVSGTVTGRQPTECEAVTTVFQHIWTLRENEIINVTE